MIVVDKLCYRSRLRYVNAAEKFAFSMITLLFCVVSRSLIVAGVAFAVNTYLTVKKGRIAAGQYAKLLAVPFTFLILSTLAIIVNISKVPLDAYAIPVGSFFITGSFHSLLFGIQLIATAMASVFISQYDNDRYSGRAGKTALPRDIDGTHASDLPVHLCAHGDCFRHDGVTEVQAGQQRSANIGEFLRKDGGGPAAPRI